MARVLYPAGRRVEAGADRSDDSFCGKQSMPHDVPCSSLRRYVGYCQGLWRVRFLCSRQVRCPKIPNRDGRGTNNSSSSVARLADRLQQIDRHTARRAMSRRRDEPRQLRRSPWSHGPGRTHQVCGCCLRKTRQTDSLPHCQPYSSGASHRSDHAGALRYEGRWTARFQTQAPEEIQ
jgi:hypothetical protein